MQYIIGIDEVGRGSVAGPVVVSGAKFSTVYPLFTHSTDSSDSRWGSLDSNWKTIRDSKKLSQINREMISNLVKHSKLQYFILYADNKLIDRFGIGVCLSHMILIGIYYLAIELNPKEVRIIIDGKIKILSELNEELLQCLLNQNIEFGVSNQDINHLSNHIIKTCAQLQIERENKADDKYLSIAAASNLAKVDRDGYMTSLSKRYPEYDWAKNKGYGTKKHLEAIQKDGNNNFLRQTFLKKYLKS